MTTGSGEEPPDVLSNLSFSDVPTPDHTATAEDDGPTPGPLPPRKRVLPGRPGFRPSEPRGPRRGFNAPREERPKKPLPPIPRNGFAPDVEKLYVLLAMGIMPFDVELAGKVQEIAGPAAEAWDELARKNEVVRRVLVSLIETGAWGKVTAAHLPLFTLAIARMTGESVRTTFAASLLGQEAEQHANRGNDGGGPKVS
jgi:hypothetical protein